VLFSNAEIPAREFLNAEQQVPLVYTVEELIARFAARRGRLDGPDLDGPPPRPEPEQGPARSFSRAVVVSVPDRDGWVLAARHSGGSLDEVVSGLRMRNLAISFSILLLLTVGLALALLSARRAERLAQLQMEFVAGVSHELRTPIAVIRQAADNLAEGVVSSAEQTREYGRLMRAEGRRLTNMVEQTLQFASSQAGKQRYSIETLTPADLIELAVAESRSEIAESGIELALDIAPDLPSVRGDSSAVMQCLRNLLSNAVKYRGPSGKISLSAAAEGRFVRFDVSDSGLGISPEDLSHVFEPFYRGRQAVDAQIQGSGLGLSLAREAAEASGGTLTAASRLGSGSTFTLRLPVATDQGASA
jgi:signal transduction histidine kinase